MGNHEAKRIVLSLRDKATGNLVEEAVGEARRHGSNYQALINWGSIVAIAYGDSLDAALQAAIDDFRAKPPISEYDVS